MRGLGLLFSGLCWSLPFSEFVFSVSGPSQTAWLWKMMILFPHVMILLPQVTILRPQVTILLPQVMVLLSQVTMLLSWPSDDSSSLLMHAISHGGCTDTVRESTLKADSERKIFCRIGNSNPSQYSARGFSVGSSTN